MDWMRKMAARSPDAASEFSVGDRVRVASIVTLRAEESLTSVQIGELPPGTELTITGLGQGRRMKVVVPAYSNAEGWISHRTKNDELLVNKIAGPAPSPSADTSFGSPASANIEVTLEEAKEAAESALAIHGPGSEQALEAVAVLRSEIERLRRQTQEAAENGRMESIESMIGMSEKYSDIAQQLESASTTPATSRSVSPAPPLAQAVEVPDSSVGGSEKSEKKKKKKQKHNKEVAFEPEPGLPGLPGVDDSWQQARHAGWDADGGGFDAAAYPHGGADQGFGGAGEGFGGFEGFSGPPAPGAQDSFGGGFGGDLGSAEQPAFSAGSAPQTSGFEVGVGESPALPTPPEPPQSWEGPPAVAGGGSSAAVEALRQQNVQLESQVQALRQQLAHARRAPLGDPLDQDGLSRTCNGLREANKELQSELDDMRQELQRAHDRVAQAVDKLAEREQHISETRQRLFDAKAQIARLEEEVRSQAELHAALQGRLETARAQQVAAQEEVRVLRESLGTASSLPSANQNVRYGSDRFASPLSTARPRATPPSVNKSDELATTVTSDLQADRPSLLASRSLADASSRPTIPRTPPEVWQQTSRIGKRMGALVSRMPLARRDCVDRTNDNFRTLLSDRRGLFYEDEQVIVQMSISASSSGSRPCLSFDIVLANRGLHPIHEVQFAPGEATELCELQLEEDLQGRSAGSSLQRQQKVRFRGQLQALGPFEAAPQVMLSYYLPDDSGCKARLRLPLAICQLMTPRQVEVQDAVQSWNSEELSHSEVAVACSVRAALLGAGAPFSVWRALELGGALASVPGADDNPRGILLASSFPQKGSRGPAPLFVRAELGGPSNLRVGPSVDAGACRLCVRSTSHLVNRALAQALLDVLCEVADPVQMK